MPLLLKMLKGKALGIDYGMKRVGLALSDDTRTIAFPFKYIINNSLPGVVSEIIKIIKEENIGLVVIGMPVGLKGGATEIASKISGFIDSLEDRIKKNQEDILEVEIAVHDERFSSVQARISMAEQKIKVKKRKEKVDSIASAFILQSFLDRRKNLQANLK